MQPDPPKDERGTMQLHPRKDAGERGHNDFGGASRFFKQVQTKLDESDPIRYEAKASRSERDAGLEGMEKVIAGGMSGRANGSLDGHISMGRNSHPTVKPIDLTKYLATLLLPPDEYAPRRILVPFAGVGSEMIGAMLASWEEVDGIEMEREYVEIAEKRIEYYRSLGIQEELEL